MRTFALYTLVFILCSASSLAQVGFGLQIAIDDELVADGWYTITLRFYDNIGATQPLATEAVPGRFLGGRCILVAGLSVELPPEFLENTTSAIGYALDGADERVPRLSLPAQGYAVLASRARIADALSPTFTGLVTSINELAGPITLSAGSGIDIDRAGSTLVIQQKRQLLAHGQVRSDSCDHVFRINPGIAISDRMRVTAQLVNSTTHITVATAIDVTNGILIITTAAPLLPTETILWELRNE
jgi:hypothetical protein